MILSENDRTAKPGPQPWNQIKGTLREQFALTRVRRPSRRDRIRARLLELLTDDIRDLVSETLANELPAAIHYLLKKETASGRT